VREGQNWRVMMLDELEVGSWIGRMEENFGIED